MDSIKIVVSLIASLLNSIFGFAFFILIRMFFNIQIIGAYSVIISIFTTISFITDLGFSNAHLKYYSEAKNLNEKKKFNTTFSFIRFFQFILYFFFISLILLLSNPQFNISVIYLIFIEVSLRLLAEKILLQYLNSRKLVFKKSISLNIYALTQIILLFLLLNLCSPTLYLLAIITLFSTILFISISIFFVKDIKFGKFSKEYLIKYLLFSLPLSLSFSLTIISNNIDILILNLWIPINEIANYYTAKKIHSFIFTTITQIGLVLLPVFSINHKINNEENNIQLIEFYQKYLNIASFIILLIALLYFPEIILILFGVEYITTGDILILFIIDIIIISNGYLYNLYYQSKGETYFLSKLRICKFIIYIILLIFLSSPSLKLGVFGAPIALILSNFIEQTTFFWIIKKKEEIRIHMKIFRILFLFILIYFFHYILEFLYIIELIRFLIDILLFVALLFIFKLINKKDLNFFLNTFNFRRIKNTILDEFK